MCHVKQGVNLRGDDVVVAAAQVVNASVCGAYVNAKAAADLSDESECIDM